MTRKPLAAFGGGAAVGALGGLIGLGGRRLGHRDPQLDRCHARHEDEGPHDHGNPQVLHQASHVVPSRCRPRNYRSVGGAPFAGASASNPCRTAFSSDVSVHTSNSSARRAWRSSSR